MKTNKSMKLHQNYEIMNMNLYQLIYLLFFMLRNNLI